MKQILEGFAKGKTPGPDDITTDFIKEIGNDELLEKLLELINEWWASGDIPDEITIARVVSIYNKGNPEKQERSLPQIENMRSVCGRLSQRKGLLGALRGHSLFRGARAEIFRGRCAGIL